MSEANGNGNNNLLIALAKYGVGSVIALYLTWFLVNVVAMRLSTIETYMAQQTEILKDIRFSLRSSDGIASRSELQSQD